MTHKHPEGSAAVMDVMEEAMQVLRAHGLRITGSRTETLKVFLQHTYALSQPDLDRALGEHFDRVTLYRTLTSFLDKGLIHKVLDDTGAAKYALCRSQCQSHAHADEHIHFKCESCGQTSCLDDLPFPRFQAPAGYRFSQTSVLINGVCPDCE